MRPVTCAVAAGFASGSPKSKPIELSHVGTYESGVYLGTAAEIPAYDA